MDWIYRGQSSSSWNLQTSLYREILNFHQIIDNNGCLTIEQKMINEYLSSSHLYSPFHLKVPIDKNFPKGNTPDYIEYKLEVLSIMQHYGALTRLLDWTYSPFIATFFALDGAKNDFAIYALNIKEVENFDKMRFEKEYDRSNEIYFYQFY